MANFLSCDWGTSSFRLRLVNAITQEILDEIVSKQGIADTYQNWQAMGQLETERIEFYTNILRGAIAQLSSPIALETPIILSGMASSTMGLRELPYQKFPFTWDTAQLPIHKISNHRTFTHPIYLVSGFRTETDIMRGEETLLLGCDVADDAEKVFIFPGTHSKHIWVKNKIATDFKTYMTGELFHLLGTKSVLANSIEKGDDFDAFTLGVKAAFKDGDLLHNAFLVRTRHILNRTHPLSNYAFLSGLLIGLELKDVPQNVPIYLICGEHLEKPYQISLTLRGVKDTLVCLNADEILVKGHCKIAQNIL